VELVKRNEGIGKIKVRYSKKKPNNYITYGQGFPCQPFTIRAAEYSLLDAWFFALQV